MFATSKPLDTMPIATDHAETGKQLNQRKYSNKFIIGVRRALLADWQRTGLLEDRRGDHETWARYSLVEILWIGIILDLREFGLGNPKLIELRKYFFDGPGLTKTGTGNKLTTVAVDVLHGHKDMFLLIEKNGKARICTTAEYVDAVKNGQLKDHVSLNMKPLVEKHISQLYLEPDLEWVTGLSRDEVQAILIIKSGDFSSLELTATNGAGERLRDGSDKNSNDRIADLLKHKDYKTIHITRTDATPVRATMKKRTRTKK